MPRKFFSSEKRPSTKPSLPKKILSVRRKIK